jgi:2'-5' RNA ligase
MKYLIVTLIKGNAEKFQQKILYEVAEKFKVKGAVERKPPAHITLKYSFQCDNVKPVEQNLEEFCRSHKKCKYKLDGFNHFERDVIFMDVIPSKEMKKIHIQLIKNLGKIEGITFKKFDKDTHFHSSIAHTDIKNKFENIWTFVSDKQKKFDLELDNITLLKLVDGAWKIHREFQLI